MTLLTLLKATTGGGGVAVAYRSSSTSGTTDAQGTSRTVPVPSGAAIGDIVIVALEMWQNSGDPAVTYPAGFTEIVDIALTGSGPQKLNAAWKRLSAADTGNYSMSWTGTQWNQAQAICISGALASGDPIDFVNTASTGSGTSVPSTSGTATDADFLVHLVANENSSTKTAPTNFTEVQDANYLETNYRILTGSGSTTASGGTLSTSTLSLAALIAIKPDTGGGGTTFPVDQTDSAGLVDSAVLDQTKVVTDSAGLTDVRAITASPVLTDLTGLTDTSLVELSKLVAQTDSAGLTDAAALDQSKALTDSAGLTDTTALAQSKVLTDSSGLTDTSLVESGKAIGQTDSTGLTDTQAFSQTHVLTDSIGLSDATGLAVSKNLTDSAGLTDAATVGILRDVAATDSIGLTDAAILFRTAVLTDLVGLADATAMSQLHSFTDSAGMTDAAEASNFFPITFRPNTGSTARPSSGTTVRPNSGITARP